ncbi:MAG: hypothetical protein ACRDV7_11545 [Acidimicrobiia bacterium]
MVPELRPRSVGEVLDAAVLLYRARFGALMRSAAIIVVPLTVLILLIQLSAQPDNFTVGLTGEATPEYDSDTDALVALAAIVATLVISAIMTTLVSAVTTRIVADAYVGQPDDGQSLRSVSRLALPLIGLTVVSTVGVFAGFAACVIPGIWLQVAWSVAIPVLVLERTRVFPALGRSFTLTKARFWLAFGVVWLSQLLISALSFGLAAGLGWVIQASDSATAEVIAQSVSSAVATTITLPFAAAALVALYFDLRIRTEAFDVQMMIADLDKRRAGDTMRA